MTALDIAWMRLHNLGITRADFTNPVEVVDWLAAVQAQDFSGAKWALGLRMKNASDASIEEAFDSGAILRTHVLRPTWHFVTPDDIRWLLALTGPRIHVANASMYRKLELDTALLNRGADWMAKALSGGNFLTRDDLRVVLEKEGISTQGVQRMTYLVMYAELEGLICSGPRQGKQYTYALLEERAPNSKILDAETAQAELARRYFASRGPASAQDFSKWSGLTITAARAGLEAVKAGLQEMVVNGQSYWFAEPAAAGVSPDPQAWLLSVYDEYISSYRDHSAIVTPENGARMAALGNDLTSIIVVDGQVAGTWKRALRTREVSIALSPFAPLSEAQERAVEAAAERYGAYLGLPLVALSFA